MEESEIIQQVIGFRQEAERARRHRILMNAENRAVYHGQQDWSDKIEGQSTEFLPKTTTAVETFAAFIRRAISQYGDWFTVELPESSPISPHSVRKLMLCFLENIPYRTETRDFGSVIAEAIKIALLESIAIFKVYGREEEDEFRLYIDLVRPEDYYPDASGQSLYEIHEIEMDYHQAVELAEKGVYQMSKITHLEGAKRTDTLLHRREIEETGVDVKSSKARKTVKITEYWGSIIDDNDKTWKKNICLTLGNDTELVRKPMENPWRHGGTPFSTMPILRVPFSVWHKAVWDAASPLNRTMNELFSLMVDGSIAEVWGTREVRLGWLEDPSQVSNGIPQGATLAVNDAAPPGVSAISQSTTGQVPRESMAMFEALDREFQAATFGNDIRLGQLPPKKVTATEVTEAQQSASVMLDSITMDIEQALENVLRKAWWIILQFSDSIPLSKLQESMGLKDMVALARMPMDERMDKLGHTCTFKVRGISASLARSRDFQKMLVLLQVVGGNPMLSQVFFQKYDVEKILGQLLKHLNIDPSELMASPQQQQMQQQQQQQPQPPQPQQPTVASLGGSFGMEPTHV
jgi:hypothetical protein